MPDSPQDVYKKVLGKKGEKLAEKFLKKRGLKIVERNYSTPFGEADLIAQDGDELAFIEVKTRSGDSFGTPAEAVGRSKQERYRLIARYYTAQKREEPNARFDVVEIYDDGRIEYYEHAY